MNVKQKIELIVWMTNVSEADARRYLYKEKLDVDEAIGDILAEREGGFL